MTFKVFLAALALSISSIASAAQITKTPISGVALSYAAQTGKVYATGTLTSGMILTNSLSTVAVNKDLTGSFEVDDSGRVRLAMKHSGAFLVGQVQADSAVVLDVPFQAYQVSETYDVVEKSFGMVDVQYITIDVSL
jgi:hypothetical protein